MAEDYSVGYRKPPKKGQFKKGTSGNPKGRPKGSKNFATLLEDELFQRVVIKENGTMKTVTKLHAIVKSLIAKAGSGDTRAIGLIVGLYDQGQAADSAIESVMPARDRAILEAYADDIRSKSHRKKK